MTDDKFEVLEDVEALEKVLKTSTLPSLAGEIIPNALCIPLTPNIENVLRIGRLAIKQQVLRLKGELNDKD